MMDRCGSGRTPLSFRSRLRRLGRVRWLLLALFAALQVLDILTTNRGLAAAGVRELNPLMAALQAHLGSAWWLPKAAFAAWIAVAASLVRRQWPLVFAVSFCGLVAAINLASL